MIPPGWHRLVNEGDERPEYEHLGRQTKQDAAGDSPGGEPEYEARKHPDDQSHRTAAVEVDGDPED